MDGRRLASISDFGLVLDAVHFAAMKHRHQRRKNVAQTPYINHPLEVAHLLWFEGEIRDSETLAAAVLHDTVEDTETTFDELASRFGAQVCELVREVTDDKSLPRSEQKRHQVESAHQLSPRARLVKLADKISNLRDVVNQPPAGWSDARRREYFLWAKAVVDGMRGANVKLESLFDDVFHRFLEAQSTKN